MGLRAGELGDTLSLRHAGVGSDPGPLPSVGVFASLAPISSRGDSPLYKALGAVPGSAETSVHAAGCEHHPFRKPVTLHKPPPPPRVPGSPRGSPAGGPAWLLPAAPASSLRVSVSPLPPELGCPGSRVLSWGLTCLSSWGRGCVAGCGRAQPLSPDEPDGQLPGAPQAVAGLAHEHRLHLAALLPLLPGCCRLPLLRHLAVSGCWPRGAGRPPRDLGRCCLGGRASG